jgi:hypothetical protein
MGWETTRLPHCVLNRLTDGGEAVIITRRQPADRLCGLVVKVLDYRDRGPGFDSRALQKKIVDLERDPLSLVSTTEKLLDRKSSGSCLENREYGRRDPSR